MRQTIKPLDRVVFGVDPSRNRQKVVAIVSPPLVVTFFAFGSIAFAFCLIRFVVRLGIIRADYAARDQGKDGLVEINLPLERPV